MAELRHIDTVKSVALYAGADSYLPDSPFLRARPTVFQGFTDIRTFVSELVRQADAPQRLPGMGIQRKKSGAIPDF
ncbi:MAG: hypothetical protein ACOXZI_01050 [Candidatus Cryptobacteroides sp.]|jgi:hypothetical protein|nr:hypothetical protein [Rikenellaceae bacterium]